MFESKSNTLSDSEMLTSNNISNLIKMSHSMGYSIKQLRELQQKQKMISKAEQEL